MSPLTTENDLYTRLAYCQCGTCLPCLAYVEIQRLNEQLHKAFGIWPDGSNVHAGQCGHVEQEFQPDDVEALRRG